MFDKVIKFFTKSQEIKDARFAEFFKFYKECIQTFPDKLKQELRKSDHLIHPVKMITEADKSTYGTYSLDFQAKDLLWWSERYKVENFMVLDVETIKKQTMSECLDIIDKTPLDDMDKDVKELYKEILDDTNWEV